MSALRLLGSGDLKVTAACLGTMTFGSQVGKEASFAIMDAYVARGGNFLDTAEVYAVPITPENAGKTEEIMGEWMQARNNRDQLIIATKVCGRSQNSYIAAKRTDPENPNPEPITLSRSNIFAAIEGSLRRLRTSYVDLYQLHWPDRYAPIFGSKHYNASKYIPHTSFEETVQAMGDLIKAGKIKAWGLSNETTYGVCQFCETAKRLGVPLPVTIQNDYSVCERHFDLELAEACAPTQYNIGLLPYGILAGGALTGKYLDGKKPEGARHSVRPTFQARYHSDAVMAAVVKYKAIADKLGISLTTLMVAWANSRPCIAHGSVIIGATSLAQLEECMDAFDVKLSQETLDAIDAVHRENRNPQWAE